MAMMMDDGLFDFDCPDRWILLSAAEVLAVDDAIDAWFLQAHRDRSSSHSITHTHTHNTAPSTTTTASIESRRSIDRKLVPSDRRASRNPNYNNPSDAMKENLLQQQNHPAKAQPLSQPVSKAAIVKRAKEAEAHQPVKKVKQSVVASNSVAKPKTSASASKVTHTPTSVGGMLKGIDRDMVEILRRHNGRFALPAAYAPALHSLKDVRRWERATGKIWSQLTIEEKEAANEDIAKLKSNSKTN